ncbi:MAG: thermonuclease family protein [Sideroxydans sp.]|nr:thermonuclease family protein [Sideroxydans sp.]MDD5056599.1 thermonuclease family protein [Sideroxydans sp.]
MNKIRAAVAIPLLTLLLCSQAVLADTITGKVVSVADGDTLTILDASSTQRRIRLAQIDAPETSHGKNKPSQPFGNDSKQSLAQLTFGKVVTVTCDVTDRYGRSVCGIAVDGLDVNREQVRRGMAMVYDKYVTDSTFYNDQRTAQASKLGVWAEASPTPPWEWRKIQKAK